MIPKFGGLTGYLPKGIHCASWDEVCDAFGFTPRRRELLVGLLDACRALKRAGASQIYLDGSFTTKKPNPGDYDGCYSIVGVDSTMLDPVFLDFSNERAAMKKKFMGELFPAEMVADTLGQPYRDFFQQDRNGRKKGIVVLDLGTLP